MRAAASFSWSDKGRFGQRMAACAATAAGEAEGGGTVEPGNRDSGADGAAEAGGAAGEAEGGGAAGEAEGGGAAGAAPPANMPWSSKSSNFFHSPNPAALAPTQRSAPR